MKFEFLPASKTKTQLKCALFGESGSGKTLTSLLIAKGVVSKTGGKIIVIDTENARASKYSGETEFLTVKLNDYDPAVYLAAMRQASEIVGKTGVVIVDSMSHEWGWILRKQEELKRTRCKGNGQLAWAMVNPFHDDFVNGIIHFPSHFIATMRAKNEWSDETDDFGKEKKRITGQKARQGKDIEFEFDVQIQMSRPDNYGEIIKDGTGTRKLQGRIIREPGEALGVELIEWLNTGEDAPPAPIVEKATTEQLNQFNALTRDLKVLGSVISKRLSDVNCRTLSEVPREVIQQWIDSMMETLAKKANEATMAKAKQEQEQASLDAESAQIAKELEGEDAF